MSYKTILVHLDNTGRCDTRVSLAASLAVAQGAHLVGLATTGRLLMPHGLEAPGVYVSAVQEVMLKEGKAAIARFERAVAGTPLTSFESRMESGDPGAALIRHAPYADLLVLGQGERGKESLTTPRELPETAVLNSGCPTLLVPYAGDFPQMGRRIMFLWSATREAARALRDALPLLRAADEVRVVVFDARPGSGGHGESPGSDIGLYLARHGVKVTVNREVSTSDVGNAALSLAADVGTDLIVMGGYGHSRLRELVMGGTSRTILEAMTVPVLMSH